MDSKSSLPGSPESRILPTSKEFLGWLRRLRVPGLTERSPETLENLAGNLARRWAVLHYKMRTPLLWVLFMGGTGTGKSTVFDAFCGERVSETGMERPKTCGAVAYVHAEEVFEKGFPLDTLKVVRFSPSADRRSPLAGEPGVIQVWEHRKSELTGVVLLDTPDVDSVEILNRSLAEDLVLLADLVVFVTSQEKYADDVPSRFLGDLLRDGVETFVVCNKVNEGIRRKDVLEILNEETAVPEDRLWLFPYCADDPVRRLPESPGFAALHSAVFEKVTGPGAARCRAATVERQKRLFRKVLEELFRGLEEEIRAAEAWKEKLNALRREAFSEVIAGQEHQFSSETRAYLQAEIRKLFSKYDLLAKPRRWISNAVTAPLRMIGILESDASRERRDALKRAKQRINLDGIQAAVQRFSRRVLEESLKDREDSPLYQAIVDQKAVMTSEEVAAHIEREQEKLGEWLEGVFSEMARGLPKEKEWGIYSTSLLWGLLIVSFETVIGGGFTMVDAVLDAAVAPFVTKGAMELFAYHEIQKIARQLAEKYKESLVSVVEEQHRRFLRCLESVSPPKDAVKEAGRWLNRLVPDVPA